MRLGHGIQLRGRCNLHTCLSSGKKGFIYKDSSICRLQGTRDAAVQPDTGCAETGHQNGPPSPQGLLPTPQGFQSAAEGKEGSKEAFHLPTQACLGYSEPAGAEASGLPLCAAHCPGVLLCWAQVS